MGTPRFLALAIVWIALFVLGCVDDNGVGITTPVQPPEYSGGSWQWINPLPTGNHLYNAFFLDDNTGWIIGKAGTILHTTDGGQSWIPQSTARSVDLRAIFFHDNLNGWAVGGNPGYG
ncbi:hypothetical protein KKH27_12930 [bacterium]|nr:hypothetical protein [bacterium]MBU1983650.1 hypothetical protein [bacterium]